MKRIGGGNGQTNIVLFWWSLGGVIGGITGFVLWLVFNDSMYMSMGCSIGIIIGAVIGLVRYMIVDKHKKYDQQKESSFNMKRAGVGNKQIYTIPFFMSLGMGIGAVISLVFHEVIYMSIGLGIGTVIGLFLKILVVNKKHDQKDHSETSNRWHLQ